MNDLKSSNHAGRIEAQKQTVKIKVNEDLLEFASYEEFEATATRLRNGSEQQLDSFANTLPNFNSLRSVYQRELQSYQQENIEAEKNAQKEGKKEPLLLTKRVALH